jgi:hypothetical protein
VAASSGGIVAAWIAAGSTGLLAIPLQHALVWLGLTVVLVAGWPRRAIGAADWAILAGAIAAGVGFTVPTTAVYNVVAVAMVLGAVAWASHGVDRKALTATSYAVAVLAIYRLALVSIPAVWLASNAMGEALGTLAGTICGKPLAIGPTFGGLDFLVLMAALYTSWLIETASPRFGRAVFAAGAILGGHLVYLLALAHTHDLLAAIPKAPPVETPLYQSDLYVPPPWYWGDAVRALLPWNLPILAVVLHTIIAAAMLRWARWTPSTRQEPIGPGLQTSPPDRGSSAAIPLDPRAAIALGAIGLAAFIPLATRLSTSNLDLAGRSVVAYEHGPLDWEKPKFDRYGDDSAGQYGMLPMLVTSLGARFMRMADLSAASLADADVLLVIHPTKP